MKKQFDEDVPAETKGPGYHGKYRKLELEKKGLIRCGRCGYHKHENACGKYRKHTSWKSLRKNKFKGN